MANLKNITELPVAESVQGLNLIVNDNGAAKQIPADSVKSGVYVIDVTFPPAPNTGKLAKEALLNGKNIFIYNGTYYFLVASFKIDETTDGTTLLTLYTSHSSSTTGGVSSLAQEWSFVIFD